MPQEMQGRRIPIQPGVLVHPTATCQRAGDYYGPIFGYTDDKPAVFYLLPIARDDDAHGDARSLHHVVSPPHIFKEELDGTLTIRESIGSPHWHGFLTNGRWELNQSK